MLVLTRKSTEQIKIGEDITITILRVKGNAVRVGVDAPKSVRVIRSELPPHAAEPAAVGAAEPATEGGDPAPSAPAQSAAAVAVAAPNPLACESKPGEECLAENSDEPPLAAPFSATAVLTPARRGAPLARFVQSVALAK